MSRPKCPGLELPKAESILTGVLACHLALGSLVSCACSFPSSPLQYLPAHPSMHPQQRAGYSVTRTAFYSHALLSGVPAVLAHKPLPVTCSAPRLKSFAVCFASRKDLGGGGNLSQSTDSVRARSKREGGLRRVSRQKQTNCPA